MGFYIKEGVFMRKKSVRRRSKRSRMPYIPAPILIGTVVIALILIIVLGIILFNKFSPSKEHISLNDYYKMTSDTQVAITLDNQVLTTYGTLIDGQVYLDYQFVHDSLNSRFYWDANENILLYTTANHVISAKADENRYYLGKSSADYERVIVKASADSAWIDIDFVKKYTNIEYSYYDTPARVVITSNWTDITTSTLRGKTELRLEADIKSPILVTAKKGDTLTILETDKKWTKVCSSDGVVGFVQSPKVKRTQTQTLTSDFTPDTFAHIEMGEPINLLWHQVLNTTANSKISTILTDSKGVNVICPTWFKLKDNNGNISSLASADYVEYCHSHDVKVWGLVKNFDLDSDEIDINYILTHTSVRQRLVNQLIAQALQYNLDGINVDFETLSYSEIGDAYIQFLRELSIKCENNDIVLSTSVPPSNQFNNAYRYEEQADFVDYIALMAYDQHYGQQSGEGSVAALDWVEDGVQTLLQKDIPSDQLVLGIPFYTRLWTLTPTTEEDDIDAPYLISRENKGLTSGKTWMEENVEEPVWLDDCKQWYGEKQRNGVIYKMWLEDENSLAERLKLLDKYELAGAAFWRSGLENKEAWDLIIKYIN